MKHLTLHHRFKNALIILLPLFLLGLLASCAPKTTPAIAPIAEQSSEDSQLSNTHTVERLAMGQTIFENSCGKCHDLHKPTDYNAQDWVGILNWMAPKANLNEEQKDMVYDYVVSVKKEEKAVQ